MKQSIIMFLTIFSVLNIYSQDIKCNIHLKLDIMSTEDLVFLNFGIDSIGLHDKKIMIIYELSDCGGQMSFAEREFFSNNKILQGQYINCPDTLKGLFGIYQPYPPYFKKIEIVRYFQPLRDGEWKYYNANGELKKIEIYFNGTLVDEKNE